MLTSEQRSAATNAMAALEKERAGAWVQVLSTLDASGGSARGAALNVLTDVVPRAIESLRAELERVDRGERSWSEWVSDAQSIHTTIADVAGYTSDWSWSGVLLSTGKQTAIDVGAAAKKAGENAGLGFGLVGALVATYFAWKVFG